MNPKFSEGEVVVLQSRGFPDYNGEHTVSRIFPNEGEIFTCRISGVSLRVDAGQGNCYIFNDPLPDKSNREVIFLESPLRKKHIPGEFRYNELIKNLNTKIQERC